MSCAVALMACSAGSDQEWAGSIETLANGGIVVLNPATGIWPESETWRLVEELRIGSSDGSGPDVFSSLMSLSLAVDQDGRMFVLDGQANEVRIFDRTGAHVLSFGRAGSGPGEMRSATIAGWDSEGALWIVDPRNGRYSAFSPAGDFQASYRRPITYSMSPWPGAVDTAGRILDIGVRQGERFVHTLVRVDPHAASADTFALPGHDGGQFHILNEAGQLMSSATIPFAGQLVWRLDPRGFVWSAVTDRYRVIQQSLEGDTVLIVQREADPIPVTPAERSAALESLEDFVEDGGRIDASRIPSIRPFLTSFAVDDRGYVWVAVQGPDDAEMVRYDVFRPDGRYLGAVPTTTSLAFWPAPPIFSEEFVYGFTRDQMGVPFLVRMRIEAR
jgi:hypothetical protein